MELGELGRAAMTDRACRLMRPGDVGFVLHSWLGTIRGAMPMAAFVKSATHAALSELTRHHRDLVTNILNRQRTRVCICHPTEDDDVIAGFLVWEGTTRADEAVIHMAYVKEAFRGMGVLTAMLGKEGIAGKRYVFTHWTPAAARLSEKTGLGVYWPGFAAKPHGGER